MSHMKRWLGALTLIVGIGLGAFALASAQGERESRPGHSEGTTGGMGGMMGVAPGDMMTGRGMEEMHGFMTSERMPQAMAGMMAMARQMGNGDPMAGMVRMMEMMSMMGQMGGMMGGQSGPGGMMGPGQPQPSQ